MGWWSCDVMGGDTPLDLEGDLYNAFGVEMYPEREDEEFVQTELTPEQFTYEAIETYLDEAVRYGDEYLDIALQVLAYKGMECGADLSEWKYPIEKGIINDEWAKVDEERREVMSAFLGTFREYKGEAVPFNSKGLFEVMAEKLG